MPKWNKRNTILGAAKQPDITGCSKTITIDGIVVTISFEREEL